MPLLNPSQIHKVLSNSGVSPSPRVIAPPGEEVALRDLLESHDLSPSNLLEQLRSLTMTADSDSTRLKAVDTGLKLNGLLAKDDQVNIPVVNIIIKDSEFASINPILIPR